MLVSKAVEQALAMLDLMLISGMFAHMISFSVAISVCEKGEQWDRHWRCLVRDAVMTIQDFDTPQSRLRKKSKAFDVISFCTAISACENGGKCEQALKVLCSKRIIN